MKTNTQSGNILFLILLAVVLFAALSYAVTSSLRGGGTDASGEKLTAEIAAMIQFMDQVDAAVLRMNMTKNIRIETISFRHDSAYYGTNAPIVDYMDNPNCTNDSCRVFRPDGGGAMPQIFSKLGAATPDGFTPGSSGLPGHFRIQALQWPYAKTDANDVVLVQYGMKPAVCAEVNRQMGITAQPNFSGTVQFGHNPSLWDSSTRVVSVNPEQLTGKNLFGGPVAGAGDGQYCHVYRLIIAR